MQCDGVRLLPEGSDHCQFVKDHCSSDSLIPYIRLFYCHVQPAGSFAEVVFQIFCVFVLLLVFQVLGSTAEDFFSPILTQISQDMGLPPRFAGVTLLALGNGAPDLVSAMAFVRKGQYRIAVSGLLGGGMFVGAAVAGLVIWTAQGVKARGALIRDVSGYLISALVVACLLASGNFSWFKSSFLLVMYAAFVLAVLVADTWHVIRNKQRLETPEQEQALLAENLDQPPEADLVQTVVSDCTSIEMTEPQTSQYRSASDMSDPSWRGAASAGNESRWSTDGKPLTYNERKSMSGQAYRQMALAEMAQSSTFYGGTDMERARRLALLPEEDEDNFDEQAERGEYNAPKFEEEKAEESPSMRGQETEEIEGQDLLERRRSRSQEEERHERVQLWCNSFTRHHGQLEGSGRSNEPQLPHSGSTQSLQIASCWQNTLVIWSIVATSYNIIFTAAEFPILLLRRATIPLVDNDSYSRKWFTIAMFGSPLAIIWYLGALSWNLTIPMAIVLGLIFAAVAYLKTEDEQPPEWGFGLKFPLGAALIAAYGFVIAAMWIDTIAGELVALLEYLGILSGISHEVLGMTVLAWGNSVGDLSTNSAMAKRGLSNMAMTACFAGPIINILVSLGLGFMQNLAVDHSSAVPVQLQGLDVIGFTAIWINGLCLLGVGISHQGWVPAWYGAIAISIYLLYIIVSLGVAFG